MWSVASLIYFVLGACRLALASQAEPCNQNGLEQCETSAITLSKDPSLVYPDDLESLDRACRTWNDFTNCVYKYTNRCFTAAQKSKFNQAFKEPVMNMNTLCSDRNYRKQYLTYAPCIKKIATQESNCGLQYRFLIDLFARNDASPKQLCCAREKFRKCILVKTQSNICSLEKTGQEAEMNMTVFAIHILDKSLAFVAQQCTVSSVTEENCPGIDQVITGSGVGRPNNSKGPLYGTEKDSELQSAASSEKTRRANSTNFKLGQHSSTSASNFQLGSSQSKSPSASANSIIPNTSASRPKPEPQEDNPKPDHLSGGGDKGSDGNNGEGGVSCNFPSKAFTLIAFFSVIIVFNVN